MKKILVILFSLQLLSGNTFLSEMAKIPALVHHYQEHRQENTATNFITFIEMHYNNVEHQQKDASRHGSLPLKTHAPAHAETFAFPLESTPSVSAHVLPDFKCKTLIIKENPFYDSKIRFSVFQPPRIG